MICHFRHGRCAGIVALCMALAVMGPAAWAQSIEYRGGIDLTGSNARTVKLHGNIAYVMDREEGIHVVDVSSATTPTTVTLFSVDGSLENRVYKELTISGDRAYVAMSGNDPANMDESVNRIYALDLASPTSPAVLGSAPAGINSIDEPSNRLAADGANVCILGNTLTDFEHGLMYFEFFNPSSPAQTGFWTLDGFNFDYRGVDIAGEMIVATGRGSGPTAPGFMVFRKPLFNAMKLLGHSGSHLGSSCDIKLQGSRVYLGLTHPSAGENGVEVYDLSNPVIPKLLGAAYYPETTAAIAEQNGIVYVATLSGFVKVIDATDPVDVQIVTDLALTNFPQIWDIEAQGDKVYVALGDAGLAVLQGSGLSSNRAGEWKTYR